MFSNKSNVLQVVALLRAHGVNEFVLCPGSRDIPLVQSVLSCDGVKTFNITDERSAGFFALGRALEVKRPVAVVVTSGSALLNLHPAVSEAFYQQVPLVVISADRPMPWIGQMDGQTLPQAHVFKSLVKKSVALVEAKSEEDEWFNNRLINEAILELSHHTLGPVHINVPISEPFFDFSVRSLPKERVIERICLPESGQSYSFLRMPLVNASSAGAKDKEEKGADLRYDGSAPLLGSADPIDPILAASLGHSEQGEQSGQEETQAQSYRALVQVLDSSSARFLQLLVHKPRILLLIGQDQWSLLSRAIAPGIWADLSARLAIVNENISNLCWSNVLGIKESSDYQLGTIEHIDAILAAQNMKPFIPPAMLVQKQVLERIDLQSLSESSSGESSAALRFAFHERRALIRAHALAIKGAHEMLLAEKNQGHNSEIEDKRSLYFTNYTQYLEQLPTKLGGLEIPDVVITLGGHIISKRLKKFLRAHHVEHYHVSPTGEVVDLFGSLTTIIEQDVCSFIKLLYQSLCFLDSLGENDRVVLRLTDSDFKRVKDRVEADASYMKKRADRELNTLISTYGLAMEMVLINEGVVELAESKVKSVPEVRRIKSMQGESELSLSKDNYCSSWCGEPYKWYEFSWGRAMKKERDLATSFIAAITLAVDQNEEQRRAYACAQWPYSQMRAIVELLEHVPAQSVVHLANSSSVRYAQMAERKDVIYQSNRGVNGIEGSLSTALGYAACSDVLNFIVIGDLSFFYDMNALWLSPLKANVRIMVLNNSGGEIFHALPGLKLKEKSLNAVTGTHETSVKSWVHAQGCAYSAVHNSKELSAIWERFCTTKTTGARAKAQVLEVFTSASSDMASLKELNKHGYF